MMHGHKTIKKCMPRILSFQLISTDVRRMKFVLSNSAIHKQTAGLSNRWDYSVRSYKMNQTAASN